jgi:hypothetical protein
MGKGTHSAIKKDKAQICAKWFATALCHIASVQVTKTAHTGCLLTQHLARLSAYLHHDMNKQTAVIFSDDHKLGGPGPTLALAGQFQRGIPLVSFRFGVLQLLVPFGR